MTVRAALITVSVPSSLVHVNSVPAPGVEVVDPAGSVDVVVEELLGEELLEHALVLHSHRRV